MEEITDQEEIWEEHRKWAEKHFESEQAREIPNTDKIIVGVNETINAMEIIANGKATSDDKIMDIIFDKKIYHKMTIMGEKYEDELIQNNESRKEW